MNDVITINFDLIPTSLRREWERVNSPFYVVPPPTENPKKRYIDLVLLDASSSVKLSDWLRENGLYIDYIESNPTIENGHFFEPSEQDIERATFYNVRWSDLKEEIGYATYDRYQRYVEIIVSEDALGYQFHDKFSTRANCYSIPLFNSIVANSGLKNNDSFEFASIEGSVKFFRTIIRGNINNYYDYTDIPK